MPRREKYVHLEWADNADCESLRMSLFIVLLLSSCNWGSPHARSFDNTIIVSIVKSLLFKIHRNSSSIWLYHICGTMILFTDSINSCSISYNYFHFFGTWSRNHWQIDTELERVTARFTALFKKE